MTTDYIAKKQEIIQLLDDAGISIKSVFVPFSASRNRGEKHKTLNYIVHVQRNKNSEGKTIVPFAFSVEYQMGIGHVHPKGFFDGRKNKYLINELVEKGIAGDYSCRVKADQPDIVDVLYSLIRDAGAMESPFEQWASDFGYDSDSIKAKATYDTCVSQGHKTKNLLGDTLFTQLQEMYQDY